MKPNWFIFFILLVISLSCKKNEQKAFVTGTLKGACKGFVIQRVDIALIEGLNKIGNSYYGNVVEVVSTDNNGRFSFSYLPNQSGSPLSVCIYSPNPFMEIVSGIPYGQSVELYTIFESNSAEVHIYPPQLDSITANDSLYVRFNHVDSIFAFAGPFDGSKSFYLPELPLTPYQIKQSPTGLKYIKQVTLNWKLNANLWQDKMVDLRGCGFSNDLVLY